MRIVVAYQSSQRLAFRDQNKKSFQFLQQRLSFFYPQDSIDFIELNSADVCSIVGANDILIKTSLLSPLLDKSLLDRMIGFAQRYENRIISEGAVPGTSPEFVAMGKNQKCPQKVILDNTQRRYNSQLNLFRMKRVKIFNSFQNRYADFYTWSIPKLLDFCSTKEGVEFILAYGENVRLTRYDKCPLCKSTNLFELHADCGHPVQGFLTKESSYYFKCEDCDLVYLDPHLSHRDLHIYYDLYNFETPLRSSAISEILDNLNDENVSHLSNYKAVTALIQNLPAGANCVDIGGGYGEFCQFVKNHRSDISTSMLDFRIDEELALALQDRGIGGKQCDFVEEPLDADAFDLVTNWEVIEHIDLEKLVPYFEKVYRSLKSGGYYVISTPDFQDPLCRALDFWAMAPGEHVSVLSKNVLEPIFLKMGFEIVSEFHECVTMKSANRWFKYGLEANANMSARAESWIINDFQQSSSLRDYQERLRKNNFGSELILVLRKWS